MTDRAALLSQRLSLPGAVSAVDTSSGLAVARLARLPPRLTLEFGRRGAGVDRGFFPVPVPGGPLRA